MKTTLAIMVIVVFLASGAGLVLAQAGPPVSDKKPAGAAQEPGQDRGAGADIKEAGLSRAKKPAGTKKAKAAGKKFGGASQSGQKAQSANFVRPNYSVSPGVKRDRRLVLDASRLQYYAEPGRVIGEAFWVTERDGALMMVDPQISQNLH